MPVFLHISLCLCLSLFHTHTHTHAYTYTLTHMRIHALNTVLHLILNPDLNAIPWWYKNMAEHTVGIHIHTHTHTHTHTHAHTQIIHTLNHTHTHMHTHTHKHTSNPSLHLDVLSWNINMVGHKVVSSEWWYDVQRNSGLGFGVALS